MKLTKSQKYIAATAVIIVIIAAAAGAYFLTNGSEDSNEKDAKIMAEYLVNEYDGGFGKFSLEEGSASDKATAMKENESNYLKYSKITYSVVPDGKNQFDSIKSTIESMEGFMGGTPVEVTGVSGFDQLCVYKMDIKMGTMTEFTLVYFVAYSDGVLIDGSENAMYHPGSIADDSEISELFKVISDSISA